MTAKIFCRKCMVFPCNCSNEGTNSKSAPALGYRTFCAGREATMNLIHGDCLEEMKHIESGSIDMVLTDPPYGTTACKWDAVIPLDLMWEQLKRIIKPNGAIVMTAQTPFDKVLGCSNLEMLKYEWIWEKGTATGHLNAKKMPMKAHENVLVFYDKLPTYNPQKTMGHKPMNPVYEKAEKSTEVYGGHITTKNQAGTTERYPRSVQKFSVVTTGTLHPTQKPVALMEYFLETYTEEGQTVLDFAMGSGTTGVACKRLNRDFIGIEKAADSFDIACKRINVES